MVWIRFLKRRKCADQNRWPNLIYIRSHAVEFIDDNKMKNIFFFLLQTIKNCSYDEWRTLLNAIVCICKKKKKKSFMTSVHIVEQSSDEKEQTFAEFFIKIHGFFFLSSFALISCVVYMCVCTTPQNPIRTMNCWAREEATRIKCKSVQWKKWMKVLVFFSWEKKKIAKRKKERTSNHYIVHIFLLLTSFFFFHLNFP